jgi:hypothetical protein
MKTTNLLIFSSLAFIALFLLFGCNKTPKESVTKTTNTSLSGKDVKNIILAFKQRMNSHLKETDSIPVDSVEWYLISLANYTYGDASAKGEFQSVDSAFISISLSNGHVEISEMDNKYDDLIEILRTHFNSIENEEKQFLAVDVKTVAKTSNQIDLKITSFVQFGSFSNAYLTFGENDWWKWWNIDGNNGGYCAGIYYLEDLTSDAAIQITNKVMLRRAVPTSDYCYVAPFTSIWLWPQDYPNPNHSGEYNYYRDYMFWNVSPEPDFHPCLCPAEMNFYLTGAEHIVYTADDDPNDPGAKPSGLSFMSIQLNGDAEFWPNNDSYYLHDGYAYYGTLIKRSGPPNNF